MIEIIGTAINQWDSGRSVTVTGIEASHVHFANQGDSKAAIMELVDSQALIPDYLLQTGKQLCVYAVQKVTEENRVTLESRVFPVKKRERPEDYVYEDDQRNYIYELIKSAEDATAEANRVADELRTARDNGEFTGPKGEPGTALIDDSKVGDAAWSSKNTIDKLCPSFSESGHIVTCEPVEGYPLTVTSAETSSTFTRCGKNLFDKSASNMTEVSWAKNDGTGSGSWWGYELILPPGSYVMSSEKASTYDTGYLYGQVNSLASGVWLRNWHPVHPSQMYAKPATFDEWVRVVIYDASNQIDKNEKDWAAAWFSRFNIQIEVGNTATAYEPYNGEELGFTSNEDGIVKATVPALPGVNTFINEIDGMTVTGRADPVAIINKLTNAM